MLADIDDTNILEFVQAADSVSDTKLMEACLKCWTAPGFRYNRIVHGTFPLRLC